MPNNRRRDLSAGLLALGALVILLVGLPTALFVLGHALVGGASPFTGLGTPWTWTGQQVSEALTRAVDQETILTTLARISLTVAWGALIVLILNVFVELAAQRRTGYRQVKMTGLGWSQAIAGRIAAGLLALSTASPSHLAGAAPLIPRSTPVLVVPNLAAEIAAVPAGAPAAADGPQWSSYRVVKNDSVYGIASRLANDDRAEARRVAQQILDRNLGRTMPGGERFTTPGHIEPGWLLDIPATGVGPASVDPEPASATWTVQPGDSYWEIAEETLDASLGHSAPVSATAKLTTVLMDLNVDRLGNRAPASLVFPGDVIVLPSVDTPDEAVAAPPPPVTPAEPAPTPPPTTVPVSTKTSAATTSTMPPTTAQAPVTTAGPPTTVAQTADPDDETPAIDADDIDLALAERPAVPWTEITLGGLLAAGLTITIQRLRYRRLRERPQMPTTLTPRVAHLTELAARIDGHQDRIAGLAALLPTLSADALGAATISAVQLEAEHVEILWTEPAPDPHGDWATANGGWSWTHPYIAEPGDVMQALPIAPLLVEVGLRDDAPLLLDLETAGSVSITGDPETAGDVFRHIAYTLATTPLSVSVDIRAVGFNLLGSEHLDRILAADIDEAIQLAHSRTAELTELRADCEAATLLGARLSFPAADLEPLVILADVVGLTTDEVDRLVSVGSGGSGVACVMLGRTGTAGVELSCHDSLNARWTPHNVDFVPHRVPIDGSSAVAETLRTEGYEDRPDWPRQSLFPVAQPCAQGEDDPEPSWPPPYDILVRVLGEVRVEGAPVALTPAETELLTLLACYRDAGGVNIDRLATMLSPDDWKTPKCRSIQTRLYNLRKKLGHGSDGKPLVPTAKVGRNSPATYTVSSLVRTDLELLLTVEVPSGPETFVVPEASGTRSVNELIWPSVGPNPTPFRSRAGYEWADRDGFVELAERALGKTRSFHRIVAPSTHNPKVSSLLGNETHA